MLPVCENEHWTLVVICYPGRLKEVMQNHLDLCASGQIPVNNCNGGDISMSQSEGDESMSEPEDVQWETKQRYSVGDPCIIYFDSLSGQAERGCLETVRLLVEVAFTKNLTQEQSSYFLAKYGWAGLTKQLPSYSPSVPLQHNMTDCGIYMLEYAENFLEYPGYVLEKLGSEEKGRKLFRRKLMPLKREGYLLLLLAMLKRKLNGT